MDDYHAHNLTFDYSHNFIQENADNYWVTLPFPVHKPLPEAEDPVRKHFNRQELHRRNLKAASEDLRHTHFDVFNQKFTEDNYVMVPQSTLDAYKTRPEHVPFECYDSHPVLATGSLASFRLNGRDYLVRSGGGRTLRVTNVAKLHKMKKIKFQEALRDPIVGITSMQKENEVFLVLRQEKSLDLVAFKDIDEPVDLKWSKDSKLPVLDAKFDGKLLGYIAGFSKLKLYDVEAGNRVKFKRSMKATKFEFIDENSVALMGLNEVQICDLRSEEYKSLSLGFGGCDTLCSFKALDNHLYIASRHYLLRTDLRAFTAAPEFGTHQMEASPCFMDVNEMENGAKFLCLSSQKPNDKVLFYGKDLIGGLPTKVPDTQEALLKCRLAKDVALIDGLDARLAYSTGGIKILHSSESNETSLYSSNVLGELFKQTITTTKSQEEPIEEMYQWIMKLPEPERVLHLTHVVNLSHMTEVFNRPPLEASKKFTSTKKRNLFLERFGERFAMENLGETGTRFGEIWEGEDDVETNVLGNVEPVEPEDKVASWIKSINSYSGFTEDEK